jgi:hypothetical protein
VGEADKVQISVAVVYSRRDRVSLVVFELDKNITGIQVTPGNYFQNFLHAFSQTWEQLMSF